MGPWDVELNGPTALLAVIYCCNVTLGCEQDNKDGEMVLSGTPCSSNERRVVARFGARRN